MECSVPSLLHALLRRVGIRIDIRRIGEVYGRHPLPHGIRSLSDTLDELRVGNMVCRLTPEQLAGVGGASFIAVAGRNEYPFVLVERIDDATHCVVVRTVAGRRMELAYDRFLASWSGIVLLAWRGEETRDSAWPALAVGRIFRGVDRRAMWWLAACVALLLGWSALRQPESGDLRWLFKAAGLAVSLVAVGKASFDPHLARRLCRLGSRSDCNAVLRSAGARLFGWISLGELSAAYFAASLVWGLLFAQAPGAVFPWLASLALAAAVWSLAWQARHRMWCPLCLAIDAILAADCIGETIVWNGFQRIGFGQLATEGLSFGLAFAAGTISIRRFVAMAGKGRELERLKFKREQLLGEPGIFWHALACQPEVGADSAEFRPLDNGVRAGHTVTVVMNPSCPGCAEVHKRIASLKEWSVRLFFVVGDGDGHSRDAAVRMISACLGRPWEETHRLIGAWYERQELPARTAVHPEAERILAAHREFCRKAGITGTPTVLVDNRRLPAMYEAEDLKILL